MTHADVFTVKGRRERKENPLGLYIAVIRENPKADESRHRQLFKHTILSDGYEDFLDAVVDEWERIKYSTAYRAAMPPTVSAIKTKAESRKRDKAREDEAVGKAKLLIGQRLLALTMPNGKLLGDCTGAECVVFGGLYTRIGERVGPRRIVRKVLAASDIAAMAG